MNTQISHPHKKDVSFELDVRYEISFNSALFVNNYQLSAKVILSGEY